MTNERFTLWRNDEGLFWLVNENRVIECLYRCEDESEVFEQGYLPLIGVFDIDNIDIDEEIDEEIDFDELYVEPLPPDDRILSVRVNGEDYVLIHRCGRAVLVQDDEPRYCDEGEEFFCREGLFVVQDNRWVEIEPFWQDEEAVWFTDNGGKPVYIWLYQIEWPMRGSEYTKVGKAGDVFEIEGGNISTDGLTWSHVVLDDED